MIMAFDGNVYSGKTSLIEELSKNKSFQVINEHSEFVKLDGNLNDLWGIHKKYIDAEIKRKKFLKNNNTLLDRSLISLSAHVWAMYKLNKIDMRKDFIKKMFELIDKNKIILPELFIFVKCDFNRAKKRLIKQRNSMKAKGTADFLIAKDYFNYIHDFNQKIQKKLPGTIINTNRSLKYSTKRMKKIIRLNSFQVNKKQVKQVIYNALIDDKDE